MTGIIHARGSEARIRLRAGRTYVYYKQAGCPRRREGRVTSGGRGSGMAAIGTVTD